MLKMCIYYKFLHSTMQKLILLNMLKMLLCTFVHYFLVQMGIASKCEYTPSIHSKIVVYNILFTVFPIWLILLECLHDNSRHSTTSLSVYWSISSLLLYILKEYFSQKVTYTFSDSETGTINFSSNVVFLINTLLLFF